MKQSATAFCLWIPTSRTGIATRYIRSTTNNAINNSKRIYSRQPRQKQQYWRGCASSGSGSSVNSSVSREEVMKTARLARLEIKEEEIESVTEEFQKIIGLFSSMEHLNVDGVEPMARPHGGENVVRDDVPVRFNDM